MSQERSELERDLSLRLEQAAPEPARDALDRALARISRTAQRPGWRVRFGTALASPAWTRAGALVVVVAAAVVVGIVIGQSGLPLGDRSPLPSATTGASVSPEPSASAPTGWAEPAEYAFTFRSSCGERSLLGQFSVIVVGGVATSFEPLDQQAKLFPGTAEDIPTLARMLELAAEARAQGGSRVEVVLDPGDGHPVMVDIDWDTRAIDDEECYLITEYTTAGTGPPQPVTTVYADWERIEMPDPAPGVFGGGTPGAVVAFNGGYIAAGTIAVSCCADGDLSENRGVIWTSPDARDWRVHDSLAIFEHAMLDDLVTDREHLLAIGRYADPAVGLPDYYERALWVSADGVGWQRVDGEPIPSVVEPLETGFVGASIGHALSNGSPYTIFMESADGLSWRITRNNWAGEVRDFAVRSDGSVVAVGDSPPLVVARERPTRAKVWISQDGKDWPRPTSVDDGASMASVVDIGGMLVAVGFLEDFAADDETRQRAMAWTSSDGLAWQRVPDSWQQDQTLTSVELVQGVLVATGDAAGGGRVNAAVWVSSDGLSWLRVPDQEALTGENAIHDVIEMPDGLLAVGSRWDTVTAHPVPVIWTAAR